MFCVECGKEAGDELIGGVCYACFRAKNQFTRLPEYVDFEVCTHCHSRKRGEVWLEGTDTFEPLIEQAIRDAVEVDRRVSGLTVRSQITPETERNFRCVVHVTGTVEGVPFEAEHATRSRIKNATCLRCSRFMGGYFEGVVQIRATGRDLTPDEFRGIRQNASRLIERIVADGDRNAFVLKDTEEHGGLDIFVGTNNAARMIAKMVAERYGGKIKEHAKIAGRKDGIDLYRLTFAVRIPEYGVGDLVIYQDAPRLVQSLSTKTVTLKEPLTGRLFSVERDDLEGKYVIPRAQAKDAVVVSQTPTEMQVLDPSTYETVTVLKPAGLDNVGETVPVIKWEGEVLALPPDTRAAAD